MLIQTLHEFDLKLKAWAVFAMSLVDGPEKTVRCRYGNSRPRLWRRNRLLFLASL